MADTSPAACFALGIGMIFAFLTSMGVGVWLAGSGTGSVARASDDGRSWLCRLWTGKAGEKLEGTVIVCGPIIRFCFMAALRTARCGHDGIAANHPAGRIAIRSHEVEGDVLNSWRANSPASRRIQPDCEYKRKICLRIGCRVE